MMHPLPIFGYFFLVACMLVGCVLPVAPAHIQPTPIPETPLPAPTLATLTDLFPATSKSATTPYPFTIRTTTIAQLTVPDGRIIAADAFLSSLATPFIRRVPPGQYPVSLSLMRERGQPWESVAAARIDFQPTQPVVWERALSPGQDPGRLKPGEFFGYAVDSGTGSFASPGSAEALSLRLDRDSTYMDTIIKATEVHSSTGSWASLIPDSTIGQTIVVFAAGYGDGVYASYWGLDQHGKPVCLITDFMVIAITHVPTP